MSLNRKILGAIGDAPAAYRASLKADGTRFLLMLTVDQSQEGIALLINRRLEMYEVEVWGVYSFFQRGSILDGELVQTKSGMSFLVFDAVRCAGDSLINKTYTERMRVAEATITRKADQETLDHLECRICSENKICGTDAMVFELKPHVHMADLNVLWHNRHLNEFESDGIVFTADSGVIKAGTNPFLYKWKPTNTIDVLIEAAESSATAGLIMYIGTPPNMFNANQVPLLMQGDGEGGDVEWTCRFVSKDDEFAEGMKESHPRRAVVECTCDVDMDNRCIYFTPVKLRPDKEYGNGITTTKKTIENIMEKITFNELSQVILPATKQAHRKRPRGA